MTKVDAVYNWQWGRMAQVSKPLFDLMTSHGYEAQHTGGGCMAWEKPLPDGGWLMITVDGCELGEWKWRNKGGWDVGRYASDIGASVYWNTGVTLAEALRIAERLPPATEDHVGIDDEALLLPEVK